MTDIRAFMALMTEGARPAPTAEEAPVVAEAPVYSTLLMLEQQLSEKDQVVADHGKFKIVYNLGKFDVVNAETGKKDGMGFKSQDDAKAYGDNHGDLPEIPSDLDKVSAERAFEFGHNR